MMCFLIGTFRKYNYGKLQNKKIYGQDIPPSYNLSKVTTPVALYYAEHDALLSYKVLVCLSYSVT